MHITSNDPMTISSVPDKLDQLHCNGPAQKQICFLLSIAKVNRKEKCSLNDGVQEASP